MCRMQRLPSLDLAEIAVPVDARGLRDFSTAELRTEMRRRSGVNIDLLVKLSPFLILLAMGIAWKVKTFMNGASLWCLL